MQLVCSEKIIIICSIVLKNKWGCKCKLSTLVYLEKVTFLKMLRILVVSQQTGFHTHTNASRHICHHASSKTKIPLLHLLLVLPPNLSPYRWSAVICSACMYAYFQLLHKNFKNLLQDSTVKRHPRTEQINRIATAALNQVNGKAANFTLLINLYAIPVGLVMIIIQQWSNDHGGQGSHVWTRIKK